jgi:hypothetical protein
VRLAYAVAVTIDVAQFLFGPLGGAGFDEILDAIAVIVVSRVIGFHPLLLPTFVLEFVPFTDMLPTWTDASRSSCAYVGGRASCQTMRRRST